MAENEDKKINPEEEVEDATSDEVDETLDERAEEEVDESTLSDKEVAEKKGKGIEGLQEGIVSGISPNEFGPEIKSSFLDYAVSTLTARAIPDARDGMKPVQRRILYAMNNEALWPNKAYRKSASIVGTTMGDFHPNYR